MNELARGATEKMRIELDSPAQYQIRLGEDAVPVNELLGQHVQLEFLGDINCIHCQRATKKSFAQGYCWPCFKSLPQCDTCIMSPEKCHFAAGTCRDEAWGEKNCMVEHFVYLANSSTVKVGITRGTQLPTRWLDQGASQAMPIFRVKTRQQSGFVEEALRAHVSDRTSWQAMLKGEPEPVDLPAMRDRLVDLCSNELETLQQRFGLQAIQLLDEADVVDIAYPVLEYPKKVKSFNLDKEPLAEGTLLGIKGQYLMFDTGVINIRKYTGYQLALRQA